MTGLFGGTFTMPVAMFGLKAMAIEGTQTGTLAEARELIALARAWKLSPPPISERPLAQAQAALDDLARRTRGRARGADGVIPARPISSPRRRRSDERHNSACNRRTNADSPSCRSRLKRSADRIMRTLASA